MMIRDRFYTGGHEYLIRFRRGTWCILREAFNDEYEEIFHGHLEECQAKMQEIYAENIEYDLNI